MQQRLVIIGAGFAGMYAALSAARLRDLNGVSPKIPEGDGYLSALINFRYMANGLRSTDETVGLLQA